MLDVMARRYGKLPTELLNVGDSFDLLVFDVAVGYEELQNRKHNNTLDHTMYDQDALREKLDKARQ